MDDFINGPWGIALLGLLQCVVLGWMYRISRLRRHANERSDWHLGPWWDWLIRVVVPITLSALFVWSLYDQVTDAHFLRDANDNLVLPNVIGLAIGGLAPILAALLSLIHSPGADEHASHVGEPECARLPGIIATVLAGASIVCVCVAFQAVCETKAEQYNADVGLTQVGQATLGWSVPLLAGGLIVGGVGLVIGALSVVRGELTSHRPSTWARAAASLSVLAVGACAGLLLAAWVMARRLDIATEQVQYGDTLSASSYATVAVVLALICGGLLWCFYRALKAAGTEAPAQPAEGIDA